MSKPIDATIAVTMTTSDIAQCANQTIGLQVCADLTWFSFLTRFAAAVSPS
jgi:hypothetical protein